MVQVRLRPLVTENVLEMIGPKRSTILPLRVAGAISFANRNPAMPADGLALPRVVALEPGNDQRRLRLELAMSHVVVRQRKVERILPRDERNRDVIATLRFLRVIETTVTRRPVEIP